MNQLPDYQRELYQSWYEEEEKVFLHARSMREDAKIKREIANHAMNAAQKKMAIYKMGLMNLEEGSEIFIDYRDAPRTRAKIVRVVGDQEEPIVVVYWLKSGRYSKTEHRISVSMLAKHCQPL